MLTNGWDLTSEHIDQFYNHIQSFGDQIKANGHIRIDLQLCGFLQTSLLSIYERNSFNENHSILSTNT